MRLAPFEFLRRFLLHVLAKGFHRIRHYGLIANGNRAESLARARELLGQTPRIAARCGGRMVLIEVFSNGCEPTGRATTAPASIGIDTS